MPAKPARLSLIRDLLRRDRVRSQDDLAVRLARRGVRATQATLSRDLKSLGVLKGPAGYALPGDAAHASDAAPPPAPDTLRAALRAMLVSAAPAGNLVVLKTGPGRAQALALELDREPPPGIAGTVAGDDTVFVAASSPARAARLARELRALSDPAS